MTGPPGGRDRDGGAAPAAELGVSSRSRRPARCPRWRKRTYGSPSTAAACAGVSPSQATSVSDSRSRSFRRASAHKTRPSASLGARRGQSPRSAGLGFSATAAGGARRLVARFPATLRATVSSHGRGGSGTSSSRRQTTRNVSDTMSSTASGGARRRAQALCGMEVAKQRLKARPPGLRISHTTLLPAATARDTTTGQGPAGTRLDNRFVAESGVRQSVEVEEAAGSATASRRLTPVWSPPSSRAALRPICAYRIHSALRVRSHRR